MTDCSPNKTPCTQLGLGSDTEGSPINEAWNYSSIVGMLLYLTTNTRPDIAFAVSQVARFTSNPKQSHAKAVKSILRYLKGSMSKGMILRPSNQLDLVAYVDADFAGLHGQEPDHLPESARSRTGYIITLGKCPVIWKSQLQSEIALSTTHAEYVALSQCMRMIIPFREMMKEALTIVKMNSSIPTTFKTTVYEDNAAALSIATNQRLTSRSKHFSVKYHHFWESVKNGEIKVEKIDTKEQNADYMTKGLPHEIYHANRRRVQGWTGFVGDEPKLWLDPLHDQSPNGTTRERESQDTAKTSALNLTPSQGNCSFALRAPAGFPTGRSTKDPTSSQKPQFTAKQNEIPDKDFG